MIASAAETHLGALAGPQAAPSIAATLAHPALYERTFRTFVRPGEVIELRALHVEGRDGRARKAISGYYDNAEAFARDVRRLDGKAKGIFFTLNPCKPELLARAPNALSSGCAAATDPDILRRRWILLDLDPCRPADTSSTDDELAAAFVRAEAVWSYLRAEGWGDPVAALSANGTHLLYPIDLPAEDGGFVRRVLRGLAKRFSDDAVTLDSAVSNASRIVKVYGTLARKGPATLERPHRRAMMLGRTE